MKRLFGKSALALTGALVFGTVAPHVSASYTWNEIQFSGFLSQGFIYSSANDYLGTESSDGDFDMREYAISGTRRFGSNWRVGAQVFGQRLGRFGHDTPTLDWAIVDYNARQEFGVRVGRVKMPRGLYNEALDLDIARVQTILPQSVYDARLRDFNASIDGGMLYGNVGLGNAGSLDYKLFFGDKPIDADGGVRDFASDGGGTLMLDASTNSAWGGSLVWSASEIALRAGVSFQNLDHLEVVNPILGVPGGQSAAFFPNGLKTVILFSEYIMDQWTFALEAGQSRGTILARTNLGTPTMSAGRFGSDFGYISAARRLNERWEIGAYSSFTKENENTDDGTDHQYDYALSLRFDPMDRVVVKAEAHYVEGTSLIADRVDAPQPIGSRDNKWAYYTAKVTLFF